MDNISENTENNNADLEDNSLYGDEEEWDSIF